MNLLSEFCFHDLLDAEKTSLNLCSADYFKVLLKCSSFLKVFKKPMSAMPFVITNNYPIWTYASLSREPILNRSMYIKCTTPIKS